MLCFSDPKHLCLTRPRDVISASPITKAQLITSSVASAFEMLKMGLRDYKDMNSGIQQLATICDNEYWNRMWIMQEVVLAVQLFLLYGTNSVAWSKLCHFDRMIRYQVAFHLSFSDQILAQLDTIQHSHVWKLSALTSTEMQRGGARSRHLQPLIETTMHCSCLDPRDKLYGLLGLTDDFFMKGFPVEYGCSVFHLYEQVLLAYSKAGSKSGLFQLSHDLQQTLVFSGRERGATHWQEESHAFLLSSLISSPELVIYETEFIVRAQIYTESFLSDTMNLAAFITESCYDSWTYLPSPFHRPDTWDSVLRSLWANNHAALAPTRNFSDSVQPRKLSAAVNMSSGNLTLFCLVDGLVGVAMSCISTGDWLYQLADSGSWAIVRGGGPRGSFKFICRALVCKAELVHSVLSDSLSWPDPNFMAVSEVEKYTRKVVADIGSGTKTIELEDCTTNIVLDMGIAEVQRLTCPMQLL